MKNDNIVTVREEDSGSNLNIDALLGRLMELSNLVKNQSECLTQLQRQVKEDVTHKRA
ncbi:hypothetical protein UFOVP116_181 [uncultured Caudovirales phage]|uniref:Uncharacterized protein n=1 Tax=uncultured Caudovirales phage TaxID=2100421 RepID=A0A6J5L9C8_9CAUD|nr:hypothetical protein UFOVP116_181 [uncultured Caudovirales phage]